MEDYKEYVSMIYKNLRCFFFELTDFQVFFFFFTETEFAENQNGWTKIIRISRD